MSFDFNLMVVFGIVLIFLVDTRWCQRKPDYKTLCNSVQEQRIDPVMKDADTFYIVVGIFDIYRRNKPYYNSLGLLFYEAFKHNVEQYQKHDERIGALMYEAACFGDKGITDIIIRLLLGSIYRKKHFILLGIFTRATKLEQARAAYLLLPDFIPLFGFLKMEYINQFYLSEDVFSVTHVLKRDMNNFYNLLTDLIENLQITEINLVADDFSNREEKEMITALESLFRNYSICILTHLETPQTLAKEVDLNTTLTYSNVAGVFFIYSNSFNPIARLMNIVHEIHPKRTFTWISTEKPPVSMLSNATRLGDLIYFSDYTTTIVNNETVKFVNDFEKITVKDNPWTRAVYKRKFRNDYQINRISSIRQGLRGKGTFFYSVISSTLSWMMKVYKANSSFEMYSPGQTRALSRSSYEEINKLKYFITGFVSRLILMQYSEKSKKHSKWRIKTKYLPKYVNISGICEGFCGPGKEKVPWNKYINCCWKCVACPRGYIRTNTSNCQKCGSNTMSNKERTRCLPYELVSNKFSKELKTITIAFVCLGLLICLFYMANFFRNRNTPIVKSSDVVPLFLHLISHTVLMFIQVLPTVFPSKGLCYSMPIFIGFFWTFSSAITFVKAQKFLYIFNSELRRTSREIITSKIYMLSTIVLCLLVQFAILFLTYSYHSDPYKIERDDVNIKEYLSCSLHSHYVVVFIYIEVLLFICMVQSYRARKLPTNFNESKYISASVLCAEVFLLSYMFGGGEDMIIDNILMCMANISLVVVKYSYRVMIILCRKHLNTLNSFHKQTFALQHSSVSKSMSSNA